MCFCAVLLSFQCCFMSFRMLPHLSITQFVLLRWRLLSINWRVVSAGAWESAEPAKRSWAGLIARCKEAGRHWLTISASNCAPSRAVEHWAFLQWYDLLSAEQTAPIRLVTPSYRKIPHVWLSLSTGTEPGNPKRHLPSPTLCLREQTSALFSWHVS